MMHRYYDERTYMFTQVDPLSGTSLEPVLSFAQGNPQSWTDRYGTASNEDIRSWAQAEPSQPIDIVEFPEPGVLVLGESKPGLAAARQKVGQFLEHELAPALKNFGQFWVDNVVDTAQLVQNGVEASLENYANYLEAGQSGRYSEAIAWRLGFERAVEEDAKKKVALEDKLGANEYEATVFLLGEHTGFNATTSAYTGENAFGKPLSGKEKARAWVTGITGIAETGLSAVALGQGVSGSAIIGNPHPFPPLREHFRKPLRRREPSRRLT